MLSPDYCTFILFLSGSVRIIKLVYYYYLHTGQTEKFKKALEEINVKYREDMNSLRDFQNHIQLLDAKYVLNVSSQVYVNHFHFLIFPVYNSVKFINNNNNCNYYT